MITYLHSSAPDETPIKYISQILKTCVPITVLLYTYCKSLMSLWLDALYKKQSIRHSETICWWDKIYYAHVRANKGNINILHGFIVEDWLAQRWWKRCDVLYKIDHHDDEHNALTCFSNDAHDALMTSIAMATCTRSMKMTTWVTVILVFSSWQTRTMWYVWNCWRFLNYDHSELLSGIACRLKSHVNQ